MNGVGIGCQQRARSDHALGHPWSFVKQAGGLVEWLDIHFDDRAAEPGEPIKRRVVAGLELAIAEKQPLAGTRHAQFDMRRHNTGAPRRPPARIRIGNIGAGHGGERGPGVIDGERKNRHAVERPAGRHDAKRRDETDARLEADDIVEPRRDTAGAGGVGAKRERHQTGSNRYARTRARSAGDKVGIDRVPWHAIGRTHPDQAGGELV